MEQTENKQSPSWMSGLGVTEFPEDNDGKMRKLAFLGYFPCPIRGQIRDLIAQKISTDWSDEPGGGTKAPWYVPGGCGGVDAYEELWKVTDQADLPEVLLSVDYGDFWRPEFRKAFVDKGLYEPVGPAELPESFKAAGLVPHASGYSFFSVFPNIIMVDTTRLKGRKIPESWFDLLDPAWEGDITMNGNQDEVGTALLLWLWKHKGDEAVRKLSRNVGALRHPSQMAKLAGSGNPEGTCLYLSNWFFADSCPHTDKVKIVVPSEGALASPIYILAKKNRSSAAQDVLDLLFSPAVAAECRERWFPHAISQKVPGESDRTALDACSYTWLGWDFVLGQNLDALKTRLEKLFLEGWKGVIG